MLKCADSGQSKNAAVPRLGTGTIGRKDVDVINGLEFRHVESMAREETTGCLEGFCTGTWHCSEVIDAWMGQEVSSDCSEQIQWKTIFLRRPFLSNRRRWWMLRRVSL